MDSNHVYATHQAARALAGVPYPNLEDLPEEIRDDLPRHAQVIYLQAYNQAWLEYRAPESPRLHTSREEVAHRVALWAVENVYERDEETGAWLLKL